MSPPLEIHTSDRTVFRQCRRRWGWSSPLRANLESVEAPAGPLWLGSACHRALEDYHGYNKFGHPAAALQAYVRACPEAARPSDWEELSSTGAAILTYYADHWLPPRAAEFHTLWIDGEPQVEVQWQLPIPGYDPKQVVYAGRFDRVVIDAHGRLWVVDYKTTARFDLSGLALNPQISAYAWAARELYGHRVEGVILFQFVKAAPKPPIRLIRGGFSMNKQQHTTYSLYREALLSAYGAVPSAYKEFLNNLLATETPEGDSFIRYDCIRRNEHNLQAEEEKIRAEVAEILNLELALYPNPTRDCIWSCGFRSLCIAMDDGSDVEFLLSSAFRPRDRTANLVDPSPDSTDPVS